jgi:hypothetical protein
VARYKAPRSLINWRGSPYLNTARICAIVFREDGQKGKELVTSVRAICPDIDLVAGVAVPPHVIAQRADKGCRYPSEHYSASPESRAVAEMVREHIALNLPIRA